MNCCDHACEEGRSCPLRYGYPTSRRYPRSLAEAFPDVRRQAFEPHEPREGGAYWFFALIAGLAFIAVLVIVWAAKR